MISVEFVERVQIRNTALSVTLHVQLGVKMVYVNEMGIVISVKEDTGEVDVLKIVQIIVSFVLMSINV